MNGISFEHTFQRLQFRLMNTLNLVQKVYWGLCCIIHTSRDYFPILRLVSFVMPRLYIDTARPVQLEFALPMMRREMLLCLFAGFEIKLEYFFLPCRRLVLTLQMLSENAYVGAFERTNLESVLSIHI